MVDLWVFDFDGTLVETAAAKRDAFFEIFPDRHAGAVEAALARWPDASRHEIIPQIVAATGDPTLDSATLVAAYGATVVERVRQAPAVTGAAETLAWAAQHGVACVFSVTPHAELVSAVRARGWERWVSDMRGFPTQKRQSLADWIVRFKASKSTVIGDGESDERAARLNDAVFLRAEAGWPMRLMERAPT